MNTDSAVVPDGKMSYCLEKDEDKARLFKAALGFEPQDAAMLQSKILNAFNENSYEAYEGEKDEHGKRYKVYMNIEGKNGRTACVRTAWIYRTDNPTIPSLVTAFPEG